MRVKTRWLALLLAVCMLTLCGCGNKAVNKDESTAAVQETTEPAEESATPAEEATEPVEETTAPAEETEEPAEETEVPAEEKNETAGESAEPAKETAEPAQDTAAEEATENKEESTENTEEAILAAAVAEEPQTNAETAADTESEVNAESEAGTEPEVSAEPKASAEPEKEAESDKPEPAVTEEEKAEAPAEASQAEETEPAEETETSEETVLIAEGPEETEPEVEEPEVQRTIEITVPAEYADVRYRIGEITWNPDDSATYRLTEEEHTRLLAEVHSDIQRELNEMCASPYFLDFFSMTANEDCTVFTVVCLSIETTEAEQKSIPQLYEFGKKFAAYEGREPGNIHIDYMNKIGNTFVMRDSERDERPASSR